MKPLRFKKADLKAVPAYIKGGAAYIGRDLGRMRGTNVWIFVMYGLLLDTVNNLWRPFSVKFLERLGGGELEIALLSALPGLVAAIVLLPGAVLFRRFTNRQRATAAFILISRALLLGIAMVPWLPPAVRPMLFVVLVAIMNCPESLSHTSMQSFIGTVFEGNTRGQAIALRTKFGQAVIPVVTILTGLIITFLPRTDGQRMVLYQIFFVAAFLVGVLEVRMFNRLKVAAPKPEPPDSPAASANSAASDDAAAPTSDFAVIPTIFKDKRFIAFFVPTIIFAFTWQAGGPLFAIHQVLTIGATEMWLAVFTLASCVAAFATGGIWQRQLRKRGNNTVFVVSGVFLSLNLLFLPLISNVQLMALLSLFFGLSTVGLNAAFFNGVLEATPDKNRMIYIAFFHTAVNISLFIAPFFAHLLLVRFGDTSAILIVGFLRGAATLLVWAAHRRGKLRNPEGAAA